MAKNTLQYEIYLKAKDQASAAVGNVGKQLEQVQLQAEETAAVLGKGAVSAIPRFNSLNNSVQQVVRELPAAAMGLNVFFMAISNNLPVLADSIATVRKENEALIKSGKATTPVWRQVLGSLLSWQTALMAGVTVLSMYGGELANWLSVTMRSNSAADLAKKVNGQLNEVRAKGVQNAQGEIAKLRVLYEVTQSETRGKEDKLAAIKALKEQYPDYFGKLKSETILVGEGAEAYEALSRSMTDAAIAKASLEKITENSKKILDLNDEKAALERLLDKAKNWSNQISGSAIVSEHGTTTFNNAISNVDKLTAKLETVKRQIESLDEANKKLSEGINISSLTDPGNGKPKVTNANLSTMGGMINKINELRKAQSEASGEVAGGLEREIRLWEEKLSLMQRSIEASLAGNLAKSGTNPIEAEAIPKLAIDSIKIPLEFDTDTLARSWGIARQQFSDSIKEIEISGKQITGILTGAIQSFAAGFGEAIASGDALEIFKSMLISLMGMLQQFGAALITAGTATLAFKSLFLNPLGAIITGAALVAATAAAKAALQNATAFANGGIVYGPTLALVGEYGGASNNPEVIAPLNKLSTLIEPAYKSFEGLRFETKLKGKDIYLAIQGVERERRRTR